MTYSEKLKDPRWKQRRCEIFEAKGNTCTDCAASGDSEPLDVHHLHYLRGHEPWEYPDEYLIPVCRSCHVNRQSIEDEAKEQIALLFGKVNIWRVYEVMKSARELRNETGPCIVLTDPSLLRDPGF